MEAPPGTSLDEGITREELQLAARNHGMPLEVLAHDRTPAGLHYLLIHYDIPALDQADWRLRVDGLVGAPRVLTLDDLRSRPSVTVPVTLECAGNGRTRLRPRALSQPWVHEAVGTAEWTGTPLADVLDEVGLDEAAVEIVFTGADRGVEGGALRSYQRSLTVAEARAEGVLLAWAMNGQPLPPQHGSPLRLVVPGWYGMASVKWLVGMTAVAEPFTGYQMTHSYRLRMQSDEPGEPLRRIAVRSLMVPPGVPEFFTRTRVLDLGAAPVTLLGRAWSGHGPIRTVEVSDDGGATWRPAEVTPPDGPWAWQRWTASWSPPRAGNYELCCRATDAAGNVQPPEPVWNLGGYANNAWQRVAVTVTDEPAA